MNISVFLAILGLWDDLDGKEVGVIANSAYEDTIAFQDLAAGTDRLHMVLTDYIVGLV